MIRTDRGGAAKSGFFGSTFQRRASVFGERNVWNTLHARPEPNDLHPNNRNDHDAIYYDGRRRHSDLFVGVSLTHTMPFRIAPRVETLPPNIPDARRPRGCEPVVVPRLSNAPALAASRDAVHPAHHNGECRRPLSRRRSNRRSHLVERVSDGPPRNRRTAGRAPIRSPQSARRTTSCAPARARRGIATRPPCPGPTRERRPRERDRRSPVAGAGLEPATPAL